MALSVDSSEPDELNLHEAGDELTAGEISQILMESATAAEAARHLEQEAGSEDSDAESIYEPSRPSSSPGSKPAASERRELPKRATKSQINYALVNWWDDVDLDI